nr:MAG TPA: hypothetical protein [Caudoviricetes sp.]
MIHKSVRTKIKRSVRYRKVYGPTYTFKMKVPKLTPLLTEWCENAIGSINPGNHHYRSTHYERTN